MEKWSQRDLSFFDHYGKELTDEDPEKPCCVELHVWYFSGIMMQVE